MFWLPDLLTNSSGRPQAPLSLTEALGTLRRPVVGSLRCEWGALTNQSRRTLDVASHALVDGMPSTGIEVRSHPHLIQPYRRCNRTVTRVRYHSPSAIEGQIFFFQFQFRFIVLPSIHNK